MAEIPFEPTNGAAKRRAQRPGPTPRLLLLLFVLLGLARVVPEVRAAETKPAAVCFRVQFILATDIRRTNSTTLITANSDIQARLKQVFRQRGFYYEVNPSLNATPWCLVTGQPERRSVSKRFDIEVVSSAGPSLSINLYADGKPVQSVKKPMPKETLVFGWDEADAAWYVVLTPQ